MARLFPRGTTKQPKTEITRKYKIYSLESYTGRYMKNKVCRYTLLYAYLGSEGVKIIFDGVLNPLCRNIGDFLHKSPKWLKMDPGDRLGGGPPTRSVSRTLAPHASCRDRPKRDRAFATCAEPPGRRSAFRQLFLVTGQLQLRKTEMRPVLSSDFFVRSQDHLSKVHRPH